MGSYRTGLKKSEVGGRLGKWDNLPYSLIDISFEIYYELIGTGKPKILSVFIFLVSCILMLEILLF